MDVLKRNKWPLLLIFLGLVLIAPLYMIVFDIKGKVDTNLKENQQLQNLLNDPEALMDYLDTMVEELPETGGSTTIPCQKKTYKDIFKGKTYPLDIKVAFDRIQPRSMVLGCVQTNRKTTPETRSLKMIGYFDYSRTTKAYLIPYYGPAYTYQDDDVIYQIDIQGNSSFDEKKWNTDIANYTCTFDSENSKDLDARAFNWIMLDPDGKNVIDAGMSDFQYVCSRANFMVKKLAKNN